MNTWYEKKRLAEQLKFFNHKPKRFISCYSKSKPRIRLLVEDKVVHSKVDIDRQMLALYQDQRARGMQNSAFGYNQLSLAGMAAQAAGHERLGVVQGSALGFLGGLIS